MDLNERNQVAGPSDCPSELCRLRMALDLANYEIQRLKERVSDMEQFQRVSGIAPCHFFQSPVDDGVTGFLEQMEVAIANKLQDIQQQKEMESSLHLQVSLSNQERLKMVAKYEAEARKVSESKATILNLRKENEDLSLRLGETQSQLLREMAERLQEDMASKAKINSLVEQEAKELDLMQLEVTELQAEHQREVKDLREAMDTLHVDNETLLSEPNSKELSRPERIWERRCAALNRRHERNLKMSLQAMKDVHRAQQKVFDHKFRGELNENFRLLVTIRAMAEEMELLEDIALKLKKQNRGVFGRRMQERDVELEKMKRKHREVEAETETGGFISRMFRRTTSNDLQAPAPDLQAPAPDLQAAALIFQAAVSVLQSTAPPPASYSLRSRMPHLDDDSEEEDGDS